MTSKLTITRARLEEIRDYDTCVTLEESAELARMALAAMDSEPVAWTWQYREQWHVTSDPRRAEFVANDGDVAVLPLYRHAQPSPERDRVRCEHAEWSHATFGNVGPVGPLKHLSKEALEAAAEPDDLSEWTDMQFLLWDAQRRAGITDEQIIQAMIEKLAVNKLREWPEPKDGEPRLHIKKQSALVLPEEITLEKVAEMTAARGAEYSIRDGIIAAKWWNACRAAMLQAGYAVRDLSTPVDPQVAEYEQNVMQAGNSPVIPDGSASMLRRWLAFGRSMQNAGSQLPHNLIAETESMLAAAPTGVPINSNGWIPVSERMPDDAQEVIVQTHSGWRYIAFFEAHSGLFYDSPEGDVEYVLVTHWMSLPAAPQETNS